MKRATISYGIMAMPAPVIGVSYTPIARVQIDGNTRAHISGATWLRRNDAWTALDKVKTAAAYVATALGYDRVEWVQLEDAQ